MNKIVVFYSNTDENKVLGVVSVPGPVLKKVKMDAAGGLSFAEIVSKHKLKQSSGEALAVSE